MRIVFMGTPDYATKILEGLLDSFEVVALVTQPDKPVGRKQILTPPHTKKFVLDRGLSLKIMQPPTLKDEKIIEELRSLSPDFIVVAAYGMLLPREVLEIAPCINLHASLLPKYRGASPIQSALLHGDTTTGVTAMLMDEGLDTGAILGYSVCDITIEDTAITLFEKLSLLAKELTPVILRNFSSILPIAQEDVDASYCKKIKKSDGLVKFVNALEVYNRYRAFIVWPGVYLESGLKLKEIHLVETTQKHNAGEILEIEDEAVIVGCLQGSLKIERVQPPSKKEMSAIDYIRGKRLKVGDYLL
ncbi:methionyl-tRNA formyltransferase [Nitratiruptor sp. YY09-18]|uniref:methionyl-tRNA formyltransferase n=1 Tax=Nitratiruptor sp. YY09-18 TaxID=2724901 RepID=UPI001916ADD1|nr:methionyl-tRNA formyltransferase [Nitratiruptor sp. YY09-18]BCD67773.1 methionyl-tRNA formyltransferase [Nitratiruptor sp. YY09-18]